MANLNAGDILNTVNSILGAVTSQGGGANQNAETSQGGGTNQNAATNPAAGLNFGDLGELAKAIQNTKFLDAEKLTALKTGVLSLATKSKLSPSVLLKLTPLLAVLQTVQVPSPNTGAAATVPNTNATAAAVTPNTSTAAVAPNTSTAGVAPNTTQVAWELIKPFLNDKDKLASLLSQFGEYGGKLFSILKAVFLRT